MQQRLRNELRNKINAIDEYFDRTEDVCDKYHSFFDEKNNEQYLNESREEQRNATEKEIIDAYKDQKEQKRIEINASKMNDNNQQNSEEDEDEEDEEEGNENIKMTV